MAHSNGMRIFQAYRVDYNLDQEAPSLFSMNSYWSVVEILWRIFGASFWKV